MATQTTEQLVGYYANLLIYQYISQLRAYNNVFVDIEPVLMPQDFSVPLVDNEGNMIVDNEGDAIYSNLMGEILPLTLQDAFTFGTAVGVQLDILAEYIGGLRTNLQLDNTFLTLTDQQFTTYLQALAARNNLGSNMQTIEAFFNQYFPGEFSIYDFESMQMSFIYSPAFGADPIAESFIMSGHLPVPMAVGATFIHNPTASAFFAYRTYNAVAQPGTSGYNRYSDPQVGRLLRYTDVLVVPFS
jgi:hypothetical protein